MMMIREMDMKLTGMCRYLLATLALCFSVTAVAQLGTPSAAAIQTAQQVGLPAVDGSGQIAGPFEGPQGTLYYLNQSGLITFFHPTQYLAYFGTVVGGGISYQYALSPQGQFVVDAQNQAQQVGVLPDDVYRYPHANAVAQVLIQYLMAIQQGQIAAPQGQVDWAAMSEASRRMHETNMAIINNMGSTGCTEHYDGVYYLGCW